MKTLPVGLRLTLWYFGIFLLAELIFAAGMGAVLRENLYDIADSELEGQAADLQRLLQADKDLPMAQLQGELAHHYQIEQSRDYLQISDAGGDVIYRSQYLGDHPLPAISLDELDRRVYANRRLGERHFRVLSEQLEAGGRVYIVRIGHTTDDQIDTLDAFRKYLLWFSPLLLLISAAGGYWLSHRAVAGREM